MAIADLEEQGDSDLTEVSLAIDGMTCGACAARIERHLNALDGVAASVNYASERARVTLSPNTALDVVLDEIVRTGYSPSRLPTTSEHTDSVPPGGDQVRRLGRRLLVAAIFSMPLCDLSLAFSLVPSTRFHYWQWLLVALALPVVTYAAWPFYVAALRAARHRTSTMDTLVSLGISAATGWSVFAMFFRDTSSTAQSLGYVLLHQSGGAIYVDVAAVVTTFLLAGRYFEATSKRKTGNALRSLAALGARDVSVLDPYGTERRVPVDELTVGDRFVVRPGETVATDGTVVTGESGIDKSAMTGESLPVEVGPGDAVVGGTAVVGGRIVVTATHVGRDTQLAHMMKLVEDAQNEKASVQRLADRVSGVFVPSVLVVAVVTLGGWLIAGSGAEHALSAAISVLIIACPCALGLATPTALLVASGQGARKGIFFKGYQALEASRQLDTVVIDKTGTVTSGQMTLTDVEVAHQEDRTTALGLAGAVENASEHTVGRAVARAALLELGSLEEVEGFSTLAGLGAAGDVGSRHVRIGRPAMFPGAPAALLGRSSEWAEAGKTSFLVERDGEVIAAMAVSDAVRESAPVAVRRLREMGLRCILLTGDSEETARFVADRVGVTEVVSGALPAQKVDVIRSMQAQGRSVAMIGDGVNDAPALAAADLGLAIGSGTDVAINAADVIVVRDDLRMVADAIGLARRTLRTIRANLVWAFAYNVVAIPLAACGLLNPIIAGTAMVLSSGFVVWNSSRLGRTSRPNTGQTATHETGVEHAAFTGPAPEAISHY